MRIAAAFLLALALAGCQTAGNFCEVARPLYLTPGTVDAMTADEVRDALAHNETGAALCGWEPVR